MGALERFTFGIRAESLAVHAAACCSSMRSPSAQGCRLRGGGLADPVRIHPDCSDGAISQSHRAGNIGEEINAAITGHESIDTLLADAKHRVNDLLSHIP